MEREKAIIVDIFQFYKRLTEGKDFRKDYEYKSFQFYKRLTILKRVIILPENRVFQFYKRLTSLSKGGNFPLFLILSIL